MKNSRPWLWSGESFYIYSQLKYLVLKEKVDYYMLRIIRLSSYSVIGGRTPFFGIGYKGWTRGIGKFPGIHTIGRRGKMTGHSFLKVSKYRPASDE